MMTESLNSGKLRMVGVGAGGHCRVLLDICYQRAAYDVVALTDHDEALHGQCWEGIDVVGSDAELPRLFAEGITNAFVGVGSVGDHSLRKNLYEFLVQEGFQMPALVHPATTIARNVDLASGVQVMAGAVINPNVRIACNTIINTAAVIEHDCVIAHHVHISPRVVLGGGVKIAEGAHIGIGATIREGIQIGKGSTVAAGAVVIKDVDANDVVMGLPAKSKLQ